MTTPAIKAMAQAMAEHARTPSDIGWRVYYGHATAALEALEENITDEMLSAGWREAAGSLDFEFLDREGVRDVFTAMLRAAREE